MNNFNEEMLNETDDEFDLEDDLWQEPELWDGEEWIPEYDEEEALEDSGMLEEEELTEAEELAICWNCWLISSQCLTGHINLIQHIL